MVERVEGRAVVRWMDARAPWLSAASLRAIRRVPPAIFNRIPSVRARIVCLRALNLALRRYPISFTATTPDGVKFTGETRDIIQRYLYIFRVWEPGVTAWMRTQVSPGSSVIDVGANIGYYTTLAAVLAGPQGRVLSVECVPSIVAHLEQHLRLNGCRNVTLAPVALGEEEGSTNVYRGAEGNIGTSSTVGDGNPEATVPVTTLDSLIDSADLQKVALVKIDVEGDEFRVLRGATKTIGALPSGAAVLVEITPEMVIARGAEMPLISAIFPPAEFDAFVIENKYSVAFYARRASLGLVPWVGDIEHQQDVVFIKR